MKTFKKEPSIIIQILNQDPIPEITRKISVINLCIFYIKYYIYIQWLYNNNYLDLYSRQTQLKAAIEIEYEICKKEQNTCKV